MKHEADLLLTGIGRLFGLHSLPNAPRRGVEMEDLGEVENAAIAIGAGNVLAVGTEREIMAAWRAGETCDVGGRLAVPGFVDAHTHPVFAGTREAEFEQRLRGVSYVEIARAGGGILSSVRGVREASEDELVAGIRARLDRFLELGTTTVEAKSGYGLSLEAELKSLRALRRASSGHPVHVVATFLGAHEIAPEYRERRADYVDLVCSEMIPAVAREGLARFCDVFTEAHVFTIEESRRVLEAGKDHGLAPKIHADELSPLGGAELAAEVGAVSADHLDHTSDQGLARLAASGTVPVLLPGVSYFLRSDHDAPARRMIERGLPVALATDLNPGSCYCYSLPMVMNLASLRMGMTPAEALTACTLNAAFGCGCGERVGSLHPGKRADVVVLDVPDYRHLSYEFGRSPVWMVIAGGQVVHPREEPR